MSLEENKKSLYRCFDDLWNKRDLSVLPEVISSEYAGHSSQGEVRGLDGFENMIQSYYTAMPDMHFTVEDVFGEGDRLASLLHVN